MLDTSGFAYETSSSSSSHRSYRSSARSSTPLRPSTDLPVTITRALDLQPFYREGVTGRHPPIQTPTRRQPGDTGTRNTNVGRTYRNTEARPKSDVAGHLISRGEGGPSPGRSADSRPPSAELPQRSQGVRRWRGSLSSPRWCKGRVDSGHGLWPRLRQTP
jgi:hypothetical protein